MPEQKLNFAEAVNTALRRALTELPETLLYGEDVGVPGGVFGVSKGLHKAFGNRVFDTPISESSILGSAVGAAMFGRRPIVEIMWSDFFLVALDQVVNQAANVRYVSNGQVKAPLTIRTQQGNAPGACAQHSQNLEAFFLHTPGIRVCMPSTPQDAHDLLLSAIWCEDPTIVIENRTLYFGPKAEVTTGGPIQPIGGLRRRREGAKATVVAWGAISQRVLDTPGDVTILETPWLNPFPWDELFDDVRRTGRLAVVHEANSTGGFGAEILARVAEQGIALKRPPVRIATPDARLPAAPQLANALIPGADRVASALKELTR